MTMPDTDRDSPERQFIADTIGEVPSSFARVAWTPEDVCSLFNIEFEEAEVWLSRNEKHIADAMVKHGWTIIETLGFQDGLELATFEDTEPPKGEGWGKIFLAG